MNRREYIKKLSLGGAGLATGVWAGGCIQRNTSDSIPEPPGHDWAIGPFVKHGTPVLTPNPDSTFYCPILERMVNWEERNVYNPTAVVRDDQLFLLYRADDTVEHGTWNRTGLAYSEDGIVFTRHAEPVIYPSNDAYKQYEWIGGTEDIHIIEDEEGTYYVNYTAWNGTTDSIVVATSKDLYAWTKHGPAFGAATSDPLLKDRTGVIVSRLEGDRLIATRIDGKYWMYYGLQSYVATSDNLTDWTPLRDEDDRPIRTLPPRPGKFDSSLCEAGAIALVTEDGIVLMYNALNKNHDEGGDPSILAGWSGLGQALMNRNNPTQLLDRLDEPFLKAEMEWELTGFIPSAVVSNALVHFNNEWLLYYGAADRRIGMARYQPST